MRKILFPTDFSDAANNAFLYALNLAKELEAELYVLNTYMQPVLSSSHAGQPEMVPEIYQTHELHQFENFKKYSIILNRLADDNGLNGVPIRYLFEEGTVVSNVLTVINKENIQLIVLGTNRASGIMNKIFGSNTLGVIRGVKIPVLSVPLEAKYRGIEEILFTTLFRDEDEAALKQIVIMAEKFRVRVKCIHVHKQSNLDTIGLAEKWTKLYPQSNLEFVFLEMDQSVEFTLNKYIEENRVDLLCVVKRNRNFLERIFSTSMSNKLRTHTNTATLVLQEGNDPGTF
ncbi:MAG: universal stress protein [Sphingobacterium sp.]|uniref:universal stress protein n=1 Tax=Sphingobacterium sp. JB170 TaxID=1434842 RepID=UPI00097E83F4|nr:universal stress protein [Sphingobacterium sp. JB170]SJN35700.1 putative universal stress protein UspA [Sphingobacterium sp. JB170]